MDAVRNRTRAERAAAGIVDLSVSIRAELRDAIDAEAAAQGLSRAGLIAKWAQSIDKKRVRKNRQGDAK